MANVIVTENLAIKEIAFHVRNLVQKSFELMKLDSVSGSGFVQHDETVVIDPEDADGGLELMRTRYFVPIAERIADKIKASGWWALGSLQNVIGNNVSLYSEDWGLALQMTWKDNIATVTVIGRGSPSPYGAYTRAVGAW